MYQPVKNDQAAIAWMLEEAKKNGINGKTPLSKFIHRSKTYISTDISYDRLDLFKCIAIVSDMNLILSGKEPHAVDDLAKARRRAYGKSLEKVLSGKKKHKNNGGKNVNKVILIGRLTKDPEIRYTQGQNQTCIAKISIAVDRRFHRDNEPDADFFDCTAFGKIAEFAEKYLKKGTKVVLSGRVQNNNYTNREGQKVYGTVIMVEEIEFAESKNASQNAQNNQNRQPDYNMRGQQVPEGQGFMHVPDDVADEELPFN